nr:RHS repeat domain-containing protein [Burkholderia pseudomallei]
MTLIGGRQWGYEWNTFGNLLAQSDPSGAISRYTYDEYGQLIITRTAISRRRSMRWGIARSIGTMRAATSSKRSMRSDSKPNTSTTATAI